MRSTDAFMLDLAARHALRAAGRVEPNPLVGAVIARRRDTGAPADDPGAWAVLGIGHHRAFGGAHAEVEAIRACAARAASPRGATCWVTLEPCNHVGKTGPCTRALIDAGIAEVIFARRDPNPPAAGGAEALRSAGLRIRVSDASLSALTLAAPFVRRLRDPRPWLIAKWAQTPKGALVAPPGADRWISGGASRARVHRLRSRVDAIIIGVGTLLADDPLLTARLRPGVRPRRTPIRVVLDSSLRTPTSSALMRSAREAPVLLVCAEGAAERSGPHVSALRSAGAEILEAPADAEGRVNLSAMLRALHAQGVHTALLESGPALLAASLSAGLVDESWAFVAGLAGSPGAALSAALAVAPGLSGPEWRPLVAKRSGADALAVWRRTEH